MLVNEIDNFETMLAQAEKQANSTWDLQFIDSLHERYDRFGEKTFITEKQLEQLERISGIAVRF